MIDHIEHRLLRWAEWVKKGHGVRLSYPSIATEVRAAFGASSTGDYSEDLISEATDRLIAGLSADQKNLVCDWYLRQQPIKALAIRYRCSRQRLYESIDRIHYYMDGALSQNRPCVLTRTKLK